MEKIKIFDRTWSLDSAFVSMILGIKYDNTEIEKKGKMRNKTLETSINSFPLQKHLPTCVKYSLSVI